MTEMREMKQDIEMLKTHVAGLLTTSQKMANVMVRLEDRVARTETRLSEEMSRGFRAMMDRFDELSDRLVDHELRLTRVERKS